ncbi:alpha/beta hydrolase [Sphingopyxis sp. MSC1_008]|uniref:alpha/beta hydrolase n=1 Tax=Sphingopyxis sp. MSC1_008 TaxID=2909265 RepID=UPI0020C03F77|nr:alpha/beta hydrolase [Sphingopyxis sp. MSC1_008]
MAGFIAMGRAVAAAAIPLLIGAASPAAAQLQDQVAPPVMPGEMTLDAALPAGAAATENWAKSNSAYLAHNVSRPTLTPFFPPEGKANGTAVVIAPGGGFMMLSMTSEGFDVGRWLASQGVTAFVLKYRVTPTPADLPGTMAAMRQKLFSGDEAARAEVFKQGLRLATDDAKQALGLVRANAAKWRIDPAKIGFMGFSAGAMTTLNLVSESDPATMPAFVAPIYGPLTAPMSPLPDKLPPLWTSMAVDDPIFGNGDLGLVSAWRAKGAPVELHLYSKGGHGYGYAGVPGTTTVHWPEQFLAWLRSNGF